MPPLNPPRDPERGPCDPTIEEEPAVMPEEAPVYVPQQEPIPVYIPEEVSVGYAYLTTYIISAK